MDRAKLNEIHWELLKLMDLKILSTKEKNDMANALKVIVKLKQIIS